MALMTRRLQVLLDGPRYERLEREAERRRVSVALLIREAIDAAFPARDPDRAAAAQRVLDADPVAVPGRYDELKAEILTLHERPFE